MARKPTCPAVRSWSSLSCAIVNRENAMLIGVVNWARTPPLALLVDPIPGDALRSTTTPAPTPPLHRGRARAGRPAPPPTPPPGPRRWIDISIVTDFLDDALSARPCR